MELSGNDIGEDAFRPLSIRLLSGPLPIPRFLPIAIRTAAALADVHRTGATHAHLGPDTILVSDDDRDVRLTGFTLDARPSREARPAASAGGRAAAYMSPEQTGRMNRAIDYRSDFYSLGATFYEVLTGAPPFRSEESLELVHAHIARTPPSPSSLDPAIPEPVSQIVMRLLAKTAEERYQSASGLRRDLEICLDRLTHSGRIEAFELGRHDVSDRFLIPQKLYGRGRELAQLLEAFEEVRDGAARLMLVSGYSGVGKTSIIHELYKPIVRQRGYFIAGKFDQVRSLPYGALIQAFRSLVWQLLTESEERLRDWRTRLSAALGKNAGVLTEIIPEMELVLGRQPPAPPLDPAEAQNRFRYVFQSLVGRLAQPEHPLVIVLDDLQWADQATLDLLPSLLSDPSLTNLLIIGAYRDNEVDASHPLALAIERLAASNARVDRLALAPLGLDDLTGFLRDTLHGEPGELAPLAELILGKTDGNPFFLIQFLKALEQRKLFEFDEARGRWAFRMDAIAGAGMTDNVIDLMSGRLQRLSPLAQAVVTLAASIGSLFALRTLVTASRLDEQAVAAGLAEALDAGLIRSVSDRYDTGGGEGGFAFLHDRVQQAAYDLVPTERRLEIHLDVGRLLRAEAGPTPGDERLFEIVNHLNLGRALIADEAERVSVAELNLAAARKAKASAAYGAAAEYASSGLALLNDRARAAHADLSFALALEAAECQYLSGDFERAERSFDAVLARAATASERALVHSLRIVFYENQSRWDQALASGREALAPFGIVFPDSADDKRSALDAELAAIDRALAGRPIGSLIDLPVMTDETIRTVMRILTSLWAPAHISGDSLLSVLISATMVRLSLAHGNTEDSAYGYVTHAITIGPLRRDFRSAYEWGELALRVNERFDDRKRRAKIHQQFQAHVNLWRRPFASCFAYAREATRSGLETGDFTYTAYSAVSESWAAMVISRDLEAFVREYTPTFALLDKLRMTGFAAGLRVMIGWARALQGRTAGRLTLTGAGFDEDEFIAAYQASTPFFLTFLYAARAQLAVLYGEFAKGVEAAEAGRRVMLSGTIWPMLLDFWGGMAIAGAYPEVPSGERPRLREALGRIRTSFAELAANCPANFQGFHLLISAEMHRLDGELAEAAGLADEAIRAARATGDVQLEAFANELAAGVWRAQGRDTIAAAFLREAHRAYTAWGAAAKAAWLEERHPQVFAPVIAPADPARVQAGGPLPPQPSPLDMFTVLEVSRALAMEIDLDELLTKLMTLALENAGAERGVFLREHDGALFVEAEASADPAEVRLRRAVPLDDALQVSRSVVRYVRRTGHDVVLADAASDERFAADPYIIGASTRSVLCVPVGHQGRLGGILYLENNLTTGAFTPDRIEIMRILAGQAAISLENARLYEDTKTEVRRRGQVEQALREAMAELEVLKNRLEVENVYLQDEIRTEHNFNEIIGNSPALLDALHKVERVAPTESTVLILGETGSGKELFARAVHNRSRRRDRPLVKVNCGAIAPGLVESELFGHVKGAFTGAIDKRIGRFEVANGGTIFLDEVGELSLEAQVKLLRVLQEREFEPVGSSRTVRVDVRVIAATNRTLDAAVREGRFRADLLYRLNVFPIDVPPLRQRGGDIRLLAGFFVAGLARKLGKSVQGFNARDMERLLAYSWPGNVRELQNVIERAAILARGPLLELEPGFGGGAHAPEKAEPPPAGATLDDMQRAHIASVLKSTGGVVEGARGAATILGMHPNTLRSRMKKLGISASQA